MSSNGVLQAGFEVLWRLAPAIAVLALLLAAEWRWPWRAPQPRRWLGNLALGGLASLLLAFLPLASMAVAAQWAAVHHFGLMNQLALPPWLAGTLAFVALDLAIYLQHRTLHTVPLLWRLHRVHHLDPMLDVSSGLRFHPFEAVASALFKVGVVAILGTPPLATLVYAVALNLSSLITHANIRLPAALDGALRRLLITPSLHRIHHSDMPGEVQCNYGTLLNVWDRLFGSWLAVSAAGESIRIGLPDRPTETNFVRMLADPLKASSSPVP